MPDAISASRIDDGPDQRHDADARRDAPRRRAARRDRRCPGSPASDSRPTSWPACAGASSSRSARRSAICRARDVDLAIGASARASCRNARAGFGVLDDLVRERCARSRSCARAARRSGATTPSRFGHEVERAGRVVTTCGASTSTPAARSMRAQRDQRQADRAPSDRRFRCARTARCRAPRSARCRRSRRAARGAGSARSRRRSGCGTCCATSTSARLAARRSRHRRSATPVWKTTVWPGQRAQLRDCAFVRSPGLPTGAAVAVGDLVGADDERVGVARGDARALASARRSAVAAGASPASGVSSTSGRARPRRAGRGARAASRR